jgi:hypothetical protein
MPMIDVYAAKGTFDDKLALTKALNHALIRWEKVPLISWFLDNTAAFIHELDPDALPMRVETTTAFGFKC